MQENSTIESKTELWELVGDRWMLPIYVVWEENFAVIELAPIPLLDAQRRLALETLAPFRNENIYIASREALGMIAKKSAFGNPQDVVEWHRTVAPALHFPKNAGVDEFLDAYVAKGVVQNRAVASAIYSTLCAHMLQWLMNGKPLPLIFATIYPLLMRKDWKVRLPDRRFKLKAFQDSLVGIAKDSFGFKAKVATWSLNLVHEPIFEHYSMRLEHAVSVSKGWRAVTYWQSVRQRIREQLVYARICLSEYRKAVRQKGVTVDESGNLGQHVPRRFWRKSRNRNSPTLLSFKLAQKEKSRLARNVPSPNAQLPAMLSVQPKENDVRDTRQDFP